MPLIASCRSMVTGSFTAGTCGGFWCCSATMPMPYPGCADSGRTHGFGFRMIMTRLVRRYVALPSRCRRGIRTAPCEAMRRGCGASSSLASRGLPDPQSVPDDSRRQARLPVARGRRQPSAAPRSLGSGNYVGSATPVADTVAAGVLLGASAARVAPLPARAGRLPAVAQSQRLAKAPNSASIHRRAHGSEDDHHPARSPPASITRCARAACSGGYSSTTRSSIAPWEASSRSS